MLAPTSEGPTLSISVMQQNNNILTACGNVNDRQHIFAIDTGETQSTIRSDVVKGKCKALSNVRLWTASTNITVSHVFIFADIVDKVIIGADFMIAHGSI